MATLEEATLAASAYRATKEAAPEFDKARKSAQLEQALANYAYYSKLAAEQLALIKELSGQAAAADSKDVDLAKIADFAASEVAVAELAEPVALK